MGNAVEFSAFSLKKGTIVSDFLLVSDKFNEQFLSRQKGYISRKLLVEGEKWADYVLWESMEDIQRAFEAAEKDTAAHEYLSFLDMGSCITNLFAVEKNYDRAVSMKIEVTNQTPQIAVAVKKEGATMAEISVFATEGLRKVFEFLAQQGVGIAGAPYLAYSNGNADFTRFDVEAGIPVQKEIAPCGEFFMSKTCEGKAVTATHKGAYKDVEIAYTALMEYMAANKLDSTGVYYDYYINNPADTPEDELLTQVVFPIK